MNNRYLIVPRPYEDESLTGYLNRICTSNMYERVKWVYNDIGLLIDNQIININRLPYDHEYIKKLTLLTGLSNEELLNMTYFNELGNLYNVDSYICETLYKSYNRKMKINICPVCLKEQLYIRKIWELTTYKICHIHKCYLIERCPDCNKFINLTNSIEKCPCGFIYTNSIPRYSEKNENFVSELIAYFVNKIEPESTENFLYKLEFRVALFLVIYFSLKIDNASYKIKFRTEKSIKVLNSTFKIFEKWPANYYRFLESKRKGKSNAEYNGLMKEFQNVYTDLYKKLNRDKELSFITKAFEEYVLNVWDGGTISKRAQLDLVNKHS